jgi:hypothetical protein
VNEVQECFPFEGKNYSGSEINGTNESKTWLIYSYNPREPQREYISPKGPSIDGSIPQGNINREPTRDFIQTECLLCKNIYGLVEFEVRSTNFIAVFVAYLFFVYLHR